MHHLSISLIYVSIFFSLSTFSYANSGIESDHLHKPFDELLQDHVVDGHVDYAGIQKDSRFSDYLLSIQRAKPEKLATKAEQLAFWINAYNALAIKGIIDGKSPSSLLGRGVFFVLTKFNVAGKKLSLDHIEKKIIIPYKDNRIHFAVVCASASCPKLISQAYTAEKLNAQLSKNARDFLKNSKKNQIDVNSSKIQLSKIFDWYTKDFKKESGSVQKYIAQFVDDPKLKKKLHNDAFKIEYLEYDWGLNGTTPIN